MKKNTDCKFCGKKIYYNEYSLEIKCYNCLTIHHENGDLKRNMIVDDLDTCYINYTHWEKQRIKGFMPLVKKKPIYNTHCV